jgi:hypothetical protein
MPNFIGKGRRKVGLEESGTKDKMKRKKRKEMGGGKVGQK